MRTKNTARIVCASHTNAGHHLHYEAALVSNVVKDAREVRVNDFCEVSSEMSSWASVSDSSKSRSSPAAHRSAAVLTRLEAELLSNASADLEVVPMELEYVDIGLTNERTVQSRVGRRDTI